jgi:hypothetical protein
MLLADGQFRWNRLDNLLREGAKSSALTGDQLWLLADYVVGVVQSCMMLSVTHAEHASGLSFRMSGPTQVGCNSFLVWSVCNPLSIGCTPLQLSDNGANIRQPLIAEVTRLIDAYAAGVHHISPGCYSVDLFAVARGC